MKLFGGIWSDIRSWSKRCVNYCVPRRFCSGRIDADCDLVWLQWKQEESSLKLEYENKITQLQDENEHNAEQFEEAKLKAKVIFFPVVTSNLVSVAHTVDIDRGTQEIEDHMGEQWKQTIAKVQADASKSKAQLDEVNIKNMKLREKLANASAFRDQVGDG